jgi:RNA polymerase-binding transcription factor DksA
MLKRLLGVAKSPRTRRCTFTLEAPNAQAVALAGSFNGWATDVRPLKRTKDGTWQTILLLPPGRYEYRYFVDGQWWDDPACTERVSNGHGSENCVCHVTAAIAGKPMPAKELDKYRQALKALAASVGSGLAHDQRELMRADEPNVAGGSMPSTDAGPDSGAVEVETGVIALEERLLAEINAALGRIDAGTFGRCEQCGKQIAKTRLGAVPYARRCARCAKAARSVAG